jgi:hypothetical protein
MTEAESPAGRLGATSIDCPNPTELADFHSRLLGMRRMVVTPDGGVVAITDGAHIQAQPALWRVMFDPVGPPFCLTTVGAD